MAKTQTITRTLIIIITISLAKVLIAQSRSNGDFVYSGTACKPEINLSIYNGLYGDYGGQLVKHKKTKGAVTVANLNDTDNDTIIDLLDNNVVQNDRSSNEIDLMKLVIDKIGIFPDLTNELELITEGDIEIFENNSKSIISNRKFSISSLPKTLYIEARSVSKKVKDISVKVFLEGKEHDEVKATAIWVDEKPKKYINRVTTGIDNTIPLSLQQPDLENAIINTYVSIDNSLFGFGSNSKYNAITDNNSICSKSIYKGLDGAFGGRILMEFTILPKDIIPLLDLYGILFDVTRIHSDIIFYMPYGTSSWKSNTSGTFNGHNELANDEARSGQNDEDNSPSLDGLIYSFDNPSHTYIGNTYFITPNAFIKRNFKAEEFVRVSFNKMPEGNTLQGSRCSIKLPWKLNYGLCSKAIPGASDKTNICNKYYAHYDSNKDYSEPRKYSFPYSKSKGIFNITLFSNAETATYYLTFRAMKWEIERINIDKTIEKIGVFSKIGNDWTLEDFNKMKIIITENSSFPFEEGEKLFFNILSETILNEFN